MKWHRVLKDAYVKPHWVGERDGKEVCFIRRWPHNKLYVLCWNDLRYPVKFDSLKAAKKHAEAK